MTDIQDYFPDPLRPSIGDVQTRNLYFRSEYFIQVENVGPASESFTVDTPSRIRSVEVAADLTGEYRVQVQVDGRDVFDANAIPISGQGPVDSLHSENFPASSEITVTLVVVIGVTDPAAVTLEMEPFELAPRSPQLELHGPDRKRPSSRARIKDFNESGSLVPAIVTQRIVGKSSPLVLPIGEPLGYRPR